MHEVVLPGYCFPLVRDIGYTCINEPWNHPDRLLDFNVFIFVLDGEMFVCEDNFEFTIKKGDILFLKSGVHHWAHRETLPYTKTFWIHFYDNPFSSNENFPEYISLPQIQVYMQNSFNHKITLPKVFEAANFNYFKIKTEKLFHVYTEQREANPFYVNIEIMELLLDVYVQAKEQKHMNMHASIVRSLVAFLEYHNNRDISTELIVQTFKYNYNYLCTIFKQVTGMSIFEYHTHLRIEKSLQLLKHTSQSISEISREVGFSDPLYFSRVFKKMIGESPSLYKKSLYK